MLARLSLRLRIFLFFGLIALGGVAVVLVSLYVGLQRSAEAGVAGGFTFSAILASFGLLALSAGIWLLFDENVAKPIERVAALMRVRAHSDAGTGIDTELARYLGDLAPAAAGLADRAGSVAQDLASNLADHTAQLAAERDQLTALLTDIPVAMTVLSADLQIVLYDGQSADLLSRIAQPRLNASLTQYFEADALERALSKVNRTGLPVRCTLTSLDGAYSCQALMRPLESTQGYLLSFGDADSTLRVDQPRPLVYNFDLLDTDGQARTEDTPLAALTYAVFDTETTGLLPHKDDIVQIGALRMVHGRIIEGEVFDTLVNPGRPIPAASSAVHGITDVMVAGAPDVVEAARGFHSFATDAVLVAHNAPFDLAFLRRQADACAVTWDHPVLDTVLLSAVLFGASETHTLDAICDRLGIVIEQRDRHTALGDARATANVLARMIPMLEARGLITFGEVVTETQKHGRLLQDLN
ncbi:3'-5' exonuclease [Tropicibacter sp. Alg240-R139]|uniref:3'-5' exonuclease n=1 Tax=Tropicibacter sp. Alg240-R139 TaxID=2305991 RepID=UPI0013DFBB18|nr:3'-5' exonuclease [Tropicibacter sp. Alg240-R139]